MPAPRPPPGTWAPCTLHPLWYLLSALNRQREAAASPGRWRPGAFVPHSGPRTLSREQANATLGCTCWRQKACPPLYPAEPSGAPGALQCGPLGCVDTPNLRCHCLQRASPTCPQIPLSPKDHLSASFLCYSGDTLWGSFPPPLWTHHLEKPFGCCQRLFWLFHQTVNLSKVEPHPPFLCWFP